MNPAYEGGYYSGFGQDGYSVPEYYVQDAGYNASLHEPEMWPHSTADNAQSLHSASYDDQSYPFGQPAAEEASLYRASEALDFGADDYLESPTLGGGLSPSPSSSVSGGDRRRKVKMYDWPKQDDPVLEKRRQLAIKQKKKRDKDEREEMQTRLGIKKTEEEIKNIKMEMAMRGCNISMMQQTLAAYDVNASYGYPENAWAAGSPAPL
ncbi:uncharacterized protein LOC125036202 [Penaeus chinensis]|uniref:uncharacterized protein LOC125036202 n=1 Tax=Penaeus chinensis TaxID=139456 RepID=UPI001FB6565D|nr:uncharacterized protein LOC125036202 [Penaeus chinensis]